MAKTDVVRTLVEPLAAAAGADVYDVTFEGGTLKVALTRPDGIDLETLSTISRELGATLDEDDVIKTGYTLEVTSPGLERPLRTPDHFKGAVGEAVTIRLTGEAAKDDPDADRRVRGDIVESDDTTVTVALEDSDETRTVAIADVERARTTFSWGPEPKPGQKKPSQKNNPGQKKSTSGKKARS